MSRQGREASLREGWVLTNREGWYWQNSQVPSGILPAPHPAPFLHKELPLFHYDGFPPSLAAAFSLLLEQSYLSNLKLSKRLWCRVSVPFPLFSQLLPAETSSGPTPLNTFRMPRLPNVCLQSSALAWTPDYLPDILVWVSSGHLRLTCAKPNAWVPRLLILGLPPGSPSQWAYHCLSWHFESSWLLFYS